jgi:Rad3-related DNA helicase
MIYECKYWVLDSGVILLKTMFRRLDYISSEKSLLSWAKLIELVPMTGERMQSTKCCILNKEEVIDNVKTFVSKMLFNNSFVTACCRSCCCGGVEQRAFTNYQLLYCLCELVFVLHIFSSECYHVHSFTHVQCGFCSKSAC